MWVVSYSVEATIFSLMLWWIGLDSVSERILSYSATTVPLDCAHESCAHVHSLHVQMINKIMVWELQYSQRHQVRDKQPTHGHLRFRPMRCMVF